MPETATIRARESLISCITLHRVVLTSAGIGTLLGGIPGVAALAASQRSTALRATWSSADT
jgi:hypothetical protein